MRRLLLVTAAFTMLATLISGTVGASTGASRHHAAGPISAVPHVPSIKNGTITVGSQWTYYDRDWEVGYTGACEVLTFSSHHLFTGDLGDSGKWSGNVKLDVAASSGLISYGVSVVVSDKWNSGDSFYIGSLSYDGYVEGSGTLIAGDDPLSFGDC